MNEKRKFQRYDIDMPLRVDIMPQARVAEKIRFEGINMAAGGMLVRKGQPLPENSPLKIEIIFNFDELKTPENVEGALIMTVTGHVVRNEHEAIAIRFNDDYEISPSPNFLQ